MQAKQTLSAHVFAHSRVSSVAAPAGVAGGFTVRQFRSIDTTLGYLVTPEITLRVGHAALKSFTGAAVDNQIGVSLIWARRWW